MIGFDEEMLLPREGDRADGAEDAQLRRLEREGRRAAQHEEMRRHHMERMMRREREMMMMQRMMMNDMAVEMEMEREMMDRMDPAIARGGFARTMGAGNRWRVPPCARTRIFNCRCQSSTGFCGSSLQRPLDVHAAEKCNDLLMQCLSAADVLRIARTIRDSLIMPAPVTAAELEDPATGTSEAVVRQVWMHHHCSVLCTFHL